MFLYRLIQKYKIIKRFRKILLVFFKAGFSFVIYKIGFHLHIHPFHRLTNQDLSERANLPEKFRKALEELGPVFVKFGQILSTRSDILPDDFIKELEKLQSTVPPFSFSEAESTIVKNFGIPVADIFKSIERKPFAAASLGQVYKARLRNGQKVAVKVQRPKVKELIKLDTQVLLILAHMIEKRVPEIKALNLSGTVQEFRKWTLNELDYRKEATNCEIFNNFFRDDPHIYAPKVYWEYTRESVLTLEFVDGYSLSNIVAQKKIKGINRKEVADRIGHSFVKQFFEYGFFHADPHPGNIFVLPNGRILFLDFGMVGFLDDKMAGIGAAAFLSLIQKDVENIVALLLKLEETYDERADMTDPRSIVRVNALRKELNQLILQWSSAGQAGNFTRLFYEMLIVATRNGINVPTDLAMLSKAIVTLDVVLKELDPRFQIQKLEKPLVEQIMSKKLSHTRVQSRLQSTGLAIEDIVSRLPDSASSIVNTIEKGRFGMEINSQQLRDYERLINANSRINTHGTILASIVIASALLYQVKDQPELFGLTLAQAGLYGGLFFILVYLMSNLKTRS